ncbi:uroporphyrinogen decarboxylase [Chrysoperla carnea]|uniref:uroporphyrinogen decarboxylase n=1 Tax=Chrysoperla carnea TaxID=189513 RepID=UPI001D06E9C8|nr:uroporphyrinogen decarboxylase [Chrysoperla carnea]XP_044739240.1 uroporphyrinogen decarboxylase [Chrysoperla carnea]XP_044739248.1 uroporphyrinogen decarboxylase [Chrysoperla carnea]XP_044739255.1 uroporphyrinogen decarboxylase [Chrysoperla carnea]
MADTHQNFPTLKNDRILKAARGEPVDKIPVWVMRQAGRYLPEFQAFRKEHDFFEICQTPKLACEITLMPIRRYDLDAAIIFSDILVIPQALGMEVIMKPTVGPVLPEPLKEPSDLDKLNTTDVVSRLKYVGEAITLTRTNLEGKVPLIGFAGAPWTIMSYMIEGGGSKTMANSKKWFYKYPEESRKLLKIITDATIDYLVMQIKSGAQLIQVFESHCEYLSLDLFNTFVAPTLQQISSAIRSQGFKDIPLILFCKGGLFCLKEQTKLGYDVLGIDWTVNPNMAREIVGPNITLQGNLDPVALHAPPAQIEKLTKSMKNAFGNERYIANLGHGIYPDAPTDAVQSFINAVHNA